MKDLNALAKDINDNAKANGWWDEPRTFGEIIALCHSELSEALEEYRNDKPDVYYEQLDLDYKGAAKPEGIAIELADCIIRILDYCGHAGIDIENAIAVKHAYNQTRPYRHGGKKI